MAEEEMIPFKPKTWKEAICNLRTILSIMFIVLGIVVMFIPIDRENPNVQKGLGILIIVASCWVFETFHLAVTSLFPVILCPLLGVVSAKDIASQYFNDTIFMFLAGFLISLAMEQWNLHIRIALAITSIFESPRTILFGVMFAAWFLSMWISNTAAALIMVSNVTALVDTLEGHYGKKKMVKFSKAVMIGIGLEERR